MKKTLSLILALMLALTLVSCGNDDSGAKNDNEAEIIEDEVLDKDKEDTGEDKENSDKEKEKDKDKEKGKEKDKEKAEETEKSEKSEREESEKDEPKKESEKKPETSDKPAESKPGESKPAESTSTSEKTLGNTLLADFKTKAKAGMSNEEIANGLLRNPAIMFGGATNPVAPGDYLPGFDENEIKGYKSGVAFMPMIGAIPFVGYVFELDGTVGSSEFIARLKKKANMRWLVCAEAEEMVAGSEGNKVFFVMCPKSLES